MKVQLGGSLASLINTLLRPLASAASAYSATLCMSLATTMRYRTTQNITEISIHRAIVGVAAVVAIWSSFGLEATKPKDQLFN